MTLQNRSVRDDSEEIAVLLFCNSICSFGNRFGASRSAGAGRKTKTGFRSSGSQEQGLRLARVFSPRISPDGSRVAYLVAENKMEKDKPWKSVTQLWVVPTSGPADASRQYTRGEESISDVRWSPDGKLVGFVMNAGDEKDKKEQVWFMYLDGGEP